MFPIFSQPFALLERKSHERELKIIQQPLLSLTSYIPPFAFTMSPSNIFLMFLSLLFYNKPFLVFVCIADFIKINFTFIWVTACVNSNKQISV